MAKRIINDAEMYKIIYKHESGQTLTDRDFPDAISEEEFELGLADLAEEGVIVLPDAPEEEESNA